MVIVLRRQVATRTSPQLGIEGRLSPMSHSPLHWMACFSVLIAVVGCGSHEEHHEDHHEDEHLEHFVPAHKPADYAALVEQLENRISKQSQVSGSGEGTAATAQSATERQELIDIVGWIPELAADSELRKQEFETAVSAGVRLSIALGFEKPGEGITPVDPSSIPGLLEELKALVSKSQSSTEPM
jgi:hypothetical protein